MAVLPSVFLPEEADENPFEPIPASWYLAEIIRSEVKSTKDKTGKYLSLGFKILEGEYVGRIIYTNLNLVNKSEIAVKIAKADLKAICGAIGHEGELEDSEDIHEQEMAIKVTVKAETSQWPAKNEIKAFKDVSYLDEQTNPFDED